MKYAFEIKEIITGLAFNTMRIPKKLKVEIADPRDVLQSPCRTNFQFQEMIAKRQKN